MRRCLILLVLLFVLSGGCAARMVHAQNSGAFMPYISPQFVNASGSAPLANGFLCTYAAGSTTPKVTYQDNALTVDNHNPVQLNSAGRPVSWGTSTLVSIYLGAGADGFGTTSYKMVLYAAGTGNTCNGFTVGSTIRTIDNIYDFGQIATFGWTASATVIYPASGQDVLVGGSTDANVAASGQLHIVGTALRVYSDSTANSNYLGIRATGGVMTFEDVLNGTATHIPMHWRDGCGASPCMILDSSATTGKLTLGNAVGYPGVLSIISATSSATYDSQGATVNNVATTSLTAQTVTLTGTGLLTISNGTTSSNFTATNLGINTTSPGAALEVKSAGTSSTTAIFNSNNAVSITIPLKVRGTEKAFLYADNTTGFQIYSDVSNSTLNIIPSASYGTPALQFLSNATEVFTADATNNAAALNILVYHGGVLQRVLLGAVDSCTAGYRCLRVPN